MTAAEVERVLAGAPCLRTGSGRPCVTPHTRCLAAAVAAWMDGRETRTTK